MLAAPTQLLIQAQWWSCRATHLLGRRQAGRQAGGPAGRQAVRQAGSQSRDSGRGGRTCLSCSAALPITHTSGSPLRLTPAPASPAPNPHPHAHPPPPAHLLQMRQCLERAGRDRPQVEQVFSGQMALSSGYSACQAANVSASPARIVPGSDAEANTNSPRLTATEAEPSRLCVGCVGVCGGRG